MNHEFVASVLSDAQYVGTAMPAGCLWSVDSRTLEAGSFFVALQGARVDGHEYVRSALEKGACGALLASSKYGELQDLVAQYASTKSFIVVPDTADALMAVASAWRQTFCCPVIGITGSVGKTTTKEILGTMLRADGRAVLVSEGNQNTLIGMSLNMLKMRAHHRAAIFEMGVSKRGEMSKLAHLARPTMALITAIGHSHMEGLGSIADIAAEKRDIFKYLPPDGIGIIDGDQPLLASISYPHPVIKFGRKMVNQVQARKVEMHKDGVAFQLKLYEKRYQVFLATENSARIYNVLAAATAAHALGVPDGTICRSVKEEVVVKGRFKKYPISGTHSVIIDDSYNANPESMKAALTAFETIEGYSKKIAVLGDMLELGVNAPFWHRQLGRFLRKVPSVSTVIFVGEHVQWSLAMVPFGMSVVRVATWRDAIPLIAPHIASDASLVLVKASRGIGLNNVVDALLKGA